jgi:ATP/maltotriose-dependent transcriptional regulator MalT
MAATGASNEDIATHLAVSVRTVPTHPKHIHAKFSIHSRASVRLDGPSLAALFHVYDSGVISVCNI